jgi:hypothetical protein
MPVTLEALHLFTVGMDLVQFGTIGMVRLPEIMTVKTHTFWYIRKFLKFSLVTGFLTTRTVQNVLPVVNGHGLGLHVFGDFVTALAACLNQVVFAPVTPEEMARKAHTTANIKVLVALDTVMARAA